jgi:hypothetical protein
MEVAKIVNSDTGLGLEMLVYKYVSMYCNIGIDTV